MKKQNSIKWFTKLGGLVVLALLILNFSFCETGSCRDHHREQHSRCSSN